MSLFGQYIAEREGKEIIENEHGFAVYQFLPEGKCYLSDIFVNAEHRNIGAASLLADRVVEKAKEKGCKILIGSVAPGTKNCTDSLKVLLAYGFKLDGIGQNLIVFVKEI